MLVCFADANKDKSGTKSSSINFKVFIAAAK